MNAQMRFKHEAVTVLESGALSAKVVNARGDEFWVKTVALAAVPLTQAQRREALIDTIRVKPVSYYVAGWLLSHETRYHASAPEGDQTERAMDELEAVGMGDATVTHGANRAQGKSYMVVTEDFGEQIADLLRTETQVNCPRKISDSRQERSIQASHFILAFLGGDLGFVLDKAQNLERIRTRVPEQYKSAFDRGTRSETFA